MKTYEQIGRPSELVAGLSSQPIDDALELPAQGRD